MKSSRQKDGKNDLARPTVGSALADGEGRLSWVDDDFCAILGIERWEAVGEFLPTIIPGDNRLTDWPGAEGISLDSPYLRCEGKRAEWLESIWLRVIVRSIDVVKPFSYIVMIENITPPKASRQALLELQQRFATIINASRSPMAILLPDGTLADCNQAAINMHGMDKNSLIGNRDWSSQWFGGDDALGDRLRHAIDAARRGRTTQAVLSVKQRNGSIRQLDYEVKPIFGEDGSLSYLFVEGNDVTDLQRSTARMYEQRLLEQATVDPLTSLPNRMLAMDRLEQALAVAARARTNIVTMLVNLDDLKKINDVLGREAGDRVLLECAGRIVDVVRQSDTVARIDGDEFLLILDCQNDPALAEPLAYRILEECRRPYHVDGQEVFLTARLGLAVYPIDGATTDDLMRKAHSALVRAKDGGGNTFRFFTPRMDEESQSRLRIESRLQRAIERDELRVFFQPLVKADSLEIVGAEALLRWNNPELGETPPDVFIPIAEASDLIIPLSEWVLQTASQIAAGWSMVDLSNFRLAVNFSPRQFENKDMIDRLLSILEGSGFPPASLEVEVTERLLIGNVANARLLLGGLKDIGASLSVDDFGTGYSSLGHLKRYPFDTLKIDRSFVTDLDRSAEDRSLATAVVEMAHALRMDVIAEGVETEAQELILRELGCEILQGYRFGKPMPADAFAQLYSGTTSTSDPALRLNREWLEPSSSRPMAPSCGTQALGNIRVADRPAF